MENNHSMSRVERSRREKVTRYSVRKVSFGAASVAVAAFFMFLGNGAVYAAEPNVTATDSALAATPANNQLDENSGSSEATAPKAQADTTTPAPTDASSTSVESSTVSKAQADATTSKPADATPAPVVSSTTSTTEETPEKATPALDKKQLEDYVAEIDAKLASDSYATKTDESVATLKEHLGLAKLALTTAKSQDELTKAYRRLFMTVNSGLRSKPKAQVESPKLDTTEGKATVGKKASNTEKATGTNSIANSGKHDPRNGQALDANNPFRTGDTATTDEDNDSSINETDLNVVNPYFEANGTPTKEEKWKVIDKIDLVGWQLSNSNQTKVVIVNGKATSYGGYGGVVNQTHPYSIPLALYSTKNDATSKSDKFGGVYQDIDVKPGQEVVVGFNSTNFGGFATQNNRVKVTVSYPERGNDIQGTITWRTLGSPYSGVFTVPKGVTKVRVRLEAADGNVSQDDGGKINIDGNNYYLGPMVSNLTISTGSHIVTTTPQVDYKEVSPSATATTVQATVSLDVENKGHYSSGNNKYIVKLPDNAKYISSTGGTKAQVNDGTLTIDYKSLAPGEKKTLTYTVELPADKPSSNDFNGVNSFRTSTLYNGLSGDVVAGGVTGTVGPQTRNIPVKTQNVTVNMYKTDLENKVNELETKLAQLNKSDYTPDSWKAMKEQLATAKQILNEEQDKVPVADRKNQAEINAKLVLLEKEKAKLDLEKAAKDQIAAIEAVDGSVKEEKEAAKAKVIEALAAAKKAVDSATTEADVAAKLTEETNKFTPILPAEEVKTAAKNDIQSVLEEKKSQIAARDDLTTEEKEAAVKEAERLAQDAKNKVDSATTEESVERNKDRGEDKVEKVDPAAKAKPAAKAAIDAALKAQEQAIDAKPDSTKEEKEAAKEEARAKAETAKEAIDKATSNADVTAAKEAGVGTITPVEPKAEVKPAAKQAIEDAYTAKVAEIEKRPELTTEEKEAAKAEARKLADAAKANVDKAKTDDAVAAAEDKGTTKVADVDPVAKAKPAAKVAVDAALAEKDKAIDANDKLSDAEKSAAKAQVAAEAKKAIEAIEKATTEADVEAAKEAGKAEIAKVAPETTDYKAKAKAEVEAELAKKLAELENATDLTEAEKAAAKLQVVNKAKEAIEAIQKAATEADVDQAIRNFVYRISAVIREQEEYDLSKLFVNSSVTVKQGESLTDKDVLSKLNLPSGVEIVKVEKPTTSALGTVMAKVTVKLADGSVEEINVPVEVIVSQNHGNEGNGANNGANNTEAKVNKAKLEGAIHQLDELLLKESAKLDAETAKEANVLSADAKKVFANADATQAEVDAMVKRIEDFMAKVAPLTDHANTANDQSAQTPAVVPANNQSAQTTVVAPATTQAAANASQTLSAQANARKAAKELPNTGTVDSTVAMVAAAASALLGLGLVGRRRKEDEEA